VLAFLLLSDNGGEKDSDTDSDTESEVYIINEWKEGNTYATEDVKSIHIKTSGEEIDWHSNVQKNEFTGKIVLDGAADDDTVSDTATADNMAATDAANADTATDIETTNAAIGVSMPFVDEYDIVQTDDGGVTIPELAGCTLEDSTLPTLPAVVLSETTVSVIEKNAADLSQYGLTDSGREATVNFKDGESYTIIFGNVSPISTETYIQIKGINNVYTMNTARTQNYTSKKEFFVSKVIYPDKETQAERIIDTVEIHRQDIHDGVLRFETIELMEDEETSDMAAKHRMTAPIDFAVNVETSYDAIYGLYGLTATDVVNVNEDNLEDFFSGSEFCVVDIKISDTESHTLRFIRGIDTYYGIIDDVPTVYEFGEELWFSVQPKDINSAMILSTRIFDVRSLNVWAKDADNNMLFAGEGSNKDDYTVTLNGAITEYDRFQKFYSFLVKMSAEEICVDANTGEELASIAVNDKWDRDKTIAFYEDLDEPRKVVIEMNGQIVAKCRKSFVDVFVQNMNMFSGDTEFVINW
jgi:hypothetical protein